MSPAQRLCACPRWRWMPGMLVLVLPDPEDDAASLLPGGITTTAGDRPRVVSVRDGCVTLAWEAGAGDAEGGTLLAGDLPDLTDPATLGCLLALVREHYPDASIELVYVPDADPGDGRGWSIVVGDRAVRADGSLADALVSALERAT